MTAAFLERYRPAESPLHEADPRVKVASSFLYILAITFSRPGEWFVLAALAMPVLGLAVASRLGVLFLVRRTFLALPFVAAALPLVFTTEGTRLFSVPVVGWDASMEGAELVATIMARSWLAVGVGALLVSTTSMPDLLRSLRAFRVPPLLISTLFFAYRYVFVVAEEAERMLRARASRSAALEGTRAGGTLRWRASVAGAMVGSLFGRSLDRSDRIYAAMQARGYRGELLLLDPPQATSQGLTAGVALVAYGAAVQIMARLA